MKRSIIAAAAAVWPALAFAQGGPQEIPFVGTDALSPPADMHLGEVAGVAVNPKDGHILVFQRGNTTGPAYGAAAAQLLEFGRDGKFIREIGHNLYAWAFAHAVRVDPQGNIWAADKGSDMVIRFNPQGRVTWVFGRKPEAADEGAHPLEHPRPPLPAVDGYFRQVTDMTWASYGNTYISDGYINSRVAKIGPDGRWLKSWGGPGAEPGQFNTLHSIASDAQDRIYWNELQMKTTDQLVDRLKKIAVLVPQPEVQIRGDAGGKYAGVGRVIYACQRAGISKIAFITEPPPRSS